MELQEWEACATTILTLDVQVDRIGERGALVVRGHAVVVATFVAVQVLEHQTLVAHDDTLPHVLTQVHALLGANEYNST